MRHVRQKATPPDGGKARRVYLALRDQIARGVHADASVLPGEQRLAEDFGVSRVTIRKALEVLAQDGLIERKAGSGTIVRSRGDADEPMGADMATLMPQLVEMSARTTARLLSFTYGPAPAHISRQMGRTDSDQMQIAVRVRTTETHPFSHLTTYVPEQIARNYSEGDLATTPLYQLLERGGVTIASAEQSVSASLAAPDVAEALDLAVGSALISLRRLVRDGEGRAVEYLSALYRPDLFRLDMSLSRVGEGAARHWEPRIGVDADTFGPEAQAT